MLLEHLLRTQAGSVKIEHLLWMVFEGNDLEDSYEAARAEREWDSQEHSLDDSHRASKFGLDETLRDEYVKSRSRDGTEQEPGRQFQHDGPDSDEHTQRPPK